jgi:carbamoyltransferase
MAYNILGLNFSHNGSACVLSDGKIVFFLEEDRITRIKHDSIPIKLLEYISKTFKIDKVATSGIYDYPFSYVSGEDYNIIINKYFPKSEKISYFDHHHLLHSLYSFHNSGFKEGISLVADGYGTKIFDKNKGVKAETESIYYISYDTGFKSLYKSYRTNNGKNDRLTFSKVYENITCNLGFGFLEAGKTMGLSSYGKYNPQIPQLYKNTKGNPEVFNTFLEDWGDLKEKYKFLLDTPELKMDLAHHVQQESQIEIGDLLEKYINKTNQKYVCCSGGYFLNCVTNYYLIKRFPDINFYFDPLSGEAGTSIGAAKLAWIEKTQDKTIRPQKTLYYGPQYSKEQLIEGIKKYV